MATRPTVSPNKNASLYVGDLEENVTETQLYDLFNSIGLVSTIRICVDSESKRPLGYAYVNYHNSNDAVKAINNVNFVRLNGREIRIMFADPDSTMRKSGLGNIFVKNLHESIDNKTLYDTFSIFGDILSCKVASDMSGKSCGYGFVHFQNPEKAKEAILKVDGMEIEGNVVKVSPFKPRSERQSTAPTFTNVYVKNFTEELFPDEESFRSFFKRFGAITSTFFPLKEDGKTKGFGFVNFQLAEQARAAVDQLHEREPHRLYVSKSLTKEVRRFQVHRQYMKLRDELDQRTAGRNIYVKNLPEAMTEKELGEEFEVFGEIESLKIRRDANNNSKGFGFVLFRDVPSATRAIKEMHGKAYRNKVLFVTNFQRRHVRQQQMENQLQNTRKMMGQIAPYAMPPFPAAAPMGYQQQVAPSVMYPGAIGPYAQQQRWGLGRGIVGQIPVSPRTMHQQMQMRAQGRPQQMGQMQMAQEDSMAGYQEEAHQAQQAQQAHQTQINQEKNRRMELGDQIFRRVLQFDKGKAAKVTGMIMEMNEDHILSLLKDEKMFEMNVQKAIDMIISNERGTAE